MSKLSWNLRILLGIITLIIVLIIFFFIYYTIVRLDRNQAIEIEAYPGAQLVNAEELQNGRDHLQYTSNGADPAAIEGFYRERGYTCRTQYGTVYVRGITENNVYVRSTCLLDRSHSLGFKQSVTLRIQPERTAYQYENNDPAGRVVGGGELTGWVVIDFIREWGNVGILGG